MPRPPAPPRCEWLSPRRGTAPAQRETLRAAVPNGPVPPLSTQRENDERLIVEAAHATRARDLAVGVEAGHRRAACVRSDASNLAVDPFITEHAASGNAVEREVTERRL